VTQLSESALALLGSVVHEHRPLAALGPREAVQPVLHALLRQGYVEVCELPESRPLSGAAAELALEDDRSWASPQFGVRPTEAGLRAWEASRAGSARDFADLEREARHLRGF
jgi:hypothetical protein